VPENHEDDKTKSYTPLTKDTMVDHFRIIEKIGAGGMGEVYLAEDTKLNRKVALKFLPLHLCQDEECRVRFKREAQATARLSHANIVHLYEVSEYRDRPYFSMELVEGRTLREIIKEDELSLTSILSLAIQMCAGLTEAHESGVIHRDIKPTNILIDRKERARLLDFGLASIASESKLTRTGSALGTVGYMSPEQVRGEKLDHRSDIFSLGVVLYELLTSRQPFRKDNEGATTHAILNDTPEPVARYKTSLPSGLQHVIDKSLSKDKETRYQHTDEMLADLKLEQEELSRPSVGSIPPSTVVGQPRWRWAVALTAVAVTITVVTYVIVTRQTPEHIVAKRTQLTFLGDVGIPAISPDGEYLAYVRKRMQNGLRPVMVQYLAGGAPIKVFEDKVIFGLRWSPDGSELLFSAWNDSTPGIVVVPRMGGSSRRYSIFGADATWSPDGTQFATVGARGRIYLIDKKSGDTSSTVGDTLLISVDWSPNGKLFALSFDSDAGGFLATSDLQGKRINRITDTIPALFPAWSYKGDAIYFMERKGENPPNFFKVYVDPRTGKRKGEPILLISSLLGGQYVFSVSADGQKMVFRQKVESSNLWLAQLDHQSENKLKTTQLTFGTSEVWEPSISPDGERIAFAKRIKKEVHLFTMPVEGGTPKQITHTNIGNRLPAWSSDGDKIAYVANSGENYNVSMIDAEGGVPHAFEQTGYTNYIVWFPGERILYSSWDNYDLLDPESGATEQLMADSINGYVSIASYSPDGQKVAFKIAEYEGEWHVKKKNKWTLVVYSLDNHSRLRAFPLDQATGFLGWSPDGEWLYLVSFDSSSTMISRMRIANDLVEPVITLPWPNVWEIAMAPNCSTFVCVRGNRQSDIWLVENFDSDVR